MPIDIPSDLDSSENAEADNSAMPHPLELAIVIHDYLQAAAATNGDTAKLEVLLEGKRCQLTVSKMDGALKFIDGNVRKMINGADLTLTPESYAVLREFSQQKELERQDLDETPLAGYGTPSDGMQEFLERRLQPTDVLDTNAIRDYLDQLREYFKDIPYRSSDRISGYHTFELFAGRASAGLLLHNIFAHLFHSSSHRPHISSMLGDKDLPHMLMVKDTKGVTRKLILEVADILGCEREADIFMMGRNSFGLMLSDCDFRHGSNSSLVRINTAEIKSIR